MMQISPSQDAPTSSSNLEVEVKFLVPDLGALREQLLRIGGRLQKDRVFERNVRFDTEESLLQRRKELLRLRQDTAVTMTFKGAPQEREIDSEASVREELEIQVDDFDQAVMILSRLGFVAKQVYEKYRETFRLASVEIVLDEMPFGNFVELEGEESAIKRLADKLGLDWQRRITANYLDLLELLKQHYDLPFDDLIFANFEGSSVSIADVLT